MLQESSSVEIVTLRSGDDVCDVMPTLGGSLASWTVDGQAMFRSANPLSVAKADPFGFASFPLVPYSNRIGNGRFEWDDKVVALARNFSPEPHAIHGVGFERAWEVQARTPNSVMLKLTHRGGAAWPWPFEAQQSIRLANGVLELHLSAVNLADRPVPLAFGHHPYFPRHGAFLRFRADGVWLTGDDGLPSLLVKPFDKFDYTDTRSVARGDIDHCFAGWDGTAQIAWRGKPLAVQITASEELRHAVVCIRSDSDGFCFEPVAHVNDAVNRRDARSAMPVIAPGRAFTASIVFRAINADGDTTPKVGLTAGRPV